VFVVVENCGVNRIYMPFVAKEVACICLDDEIKPS
jgi:hypothetical protein